MSDFWRDRETPIEREERLIKELNSPERRAYRADWQAALNRAYRTDIIVLWVIVGLLVLGAIVFAFDGEPCGAPCSSGMK